jgi:L-alanine-DL-glutamate epimerase-like enolase superfamily enzyme
MRLRPLTTCYTLSLDTADAMAGKAAAAVARGLPLLKLKLGGEGDALRMRQVRAACPNARLVADANEAWTPDLLPELMRVAAETGFRADRAAAACGRRRRAGHAAPCGADLRR